MTVYWKNLKATPCNTMWLYFTDCYMMYVCNLQNVSKENLGKHKENHALSTEHERKKTWTKEQLLLKDHRPTRFLKKWKERIDWLMLMRKQPSTWWGGGGGWKENTHWWTAMTTMKKKNTKQTSSMCDMRTLPSTPKILALRPDLCVIDQFLLFSPQPVENTKT